MKFSITAASIFAFAILSTAVKADSYSDAINEYCDGLDVTNPIKDDVAVAGQDTTVTVTRVPNDHQKTITGLDLYSVGSDNTPKYIQNTWSGSYNLQSQASITDALPADTAAGYYYYRVWVSNVKDGQRGPDCIKISPTFKVTTGSHQNSDGFLSYAESLDDANYYNPEVAKGCFGLGITAPKEGDSAPHGAHVSVEFKRDSASATKTLNKLEIYKVNEDDDELVDTVWTGKETLVNIFIIKDELKIPSDKFDPNASYYYKAEVTSQHGNHACPFRSGSFKITA